MNVEKFVTPSGSKIIPVYSSKVHEDGSIELVKTGEENFWDYIQSFRDSVDIGVILKKCLQGDFSGLKRVQGFYADATLFPKTRAEILQSVIDAERNFESLPMEIKQQFDNDFNRFFTTMETPEWYDKMKMVVNKDSEVKSVEQEQ